MEWLEFHKDPVTLHSGGKSHWLVRSDLMFADEHLRKAVISFWGLVLSRLRPRPAFVLGVPRGGVPWAKALAQRIEAIYIEPDGEIPEEGEVVVVDDVVTTGHSLNEFRPDIPVRVSLAVVSRGSKSVGAAWMTIHLPLVEPSHSGQT